MISTIYIWFEVLDSGTDVYFIISFFSFFKVYIMLLYPINSSNYMKIHLRFNFYYDRVSHFLHMFVTVKTAFGMALDIPV